MAQSFLFYDLETFGLDSRADRIAQAALVRTDMELRVIDDPIVLLCRIAPDYLPSPSSCLVTGITPQQTLKDGICEADFIKRINEEFSRPGTTTLGFNSISFDDEFIRNCLYRNLMDPYEREWMNGCSRWDIINLVRATRDLRPQGISFTTVNPETNAPSFKLTDLTAENGINQDGAHDALVDVRATIAVAKLIRDKQPKLFRWALDHRSKNEIAKEINVLTHLPFLHTCPLFVSEKGNTHPLLPLFYEAEKSAALYCFDLTHDIPESAEGGYQETGIMRLMINRAPFIAPVSVLDSESEKRLGFTKAWIWQQASKALQSPALSRESILGAREPYEETAKDPDLTIYGSFPSDHDKGVMASIRAMKPEEKLSKGEHLFEDDKYHKLLWRQVARNWPEALPEKDREKWKNFCALRLISPPVEGTPTYELYMRSVTEKLESIDTDYHQKEILLRLKEYGEELFDKVIK